MLLVFASLSVITSYCLFAYLIIAYVLKLYNINSVLMPCVIWQEETVLELMTTFVTEFQQFSNIVMSVGDSKTVFIG